MNKIAKFSSAIAAAGLVLITMSTGTANAAPGQGGCLRPLVEAGTITQVQADEVHAAKESLKESGIAGREAHDQALAGLVANGTLTQSQADAIAASRRPVGEARQPRGPRTGAVSPTSSQPTASARTTSTMPNGYAQ